jgi:cytochrome c553
MPSTLSSRSAPPKQSILPFIYDGPTLPILLLVWCVSMFSMSVHAQDQQDTGRQLVMQGNGNGSLPCISCHGLNGEGNAEAGFPRLQGLNQGYLVKQIEEFQVGRRSNPIMSAAINSLTPDQMEAIADWYSSRPPLPDTAISQIDVAQRALWETGKKLATEGDWSRYIVPCQSCHGPGNRGVDNLFPALAGQHATYLRQQLEAWQSGTRQNDHQQLMLVIAQRLTPRQIESVALYLASLPGADE